MSESRFDPHKHLTNLNGSDYLEGVSAMTYAHRDALRRMIAEWQQPIPDPDEQEVEA